MSRRHITLLILFLVLCVGIGWWIGKDSASVMKMPVLQKEQVVKEKSQPQIQIENSFSTRPRNASLAWDDAAEKAGAFLNQRSIIFSSPEALENFLKKAGNRIKVLGRLDALNALRLAFLNLDDLSDLLDGSEQLGMIFPVYTPDPKGGTIQDDAVPLGNQLLAYLGVSQADGTWGKGIKIAMLDSGVVAHSTFFSTVKNFFVSNISQNPADWNGHGTAVASLIVGSNPNAQGVAPGASLSSYVVTDGNGSSDTWTLANAIMTAVDAGNQLINISMGSYGDSLILANAVKYAMDRGVLIVGASGNDGYKTSAYPGAYPGVVNAFAVDALNKHLLFSNEGQTSGVAAPGYRVNAAYPNESLIAFSGTSASAPIITGTLATIMSISASNGNPITPYRALEYLSYYANEAESAGNDTKTGQGSVNLNRFINAKNPNIQDVAVASQVIVAPSSEAAASVQVNVENRGTKAMLNVPIEVTLPSGVKKQYSIPSLSANQVQSINVPLPNNLFQNGASVSVSSQLLTSDMANFNNTLSTKYTVPAK